jgi:hypothetical protein
VATPPPAPVGNALYVATNGSDGNNGSSSAPLKTIQKALDKVQAGQQIRIRAGTYRESVETRRDGPVLIVPDGGAVVIDGGSGLSENGPRFVHDRYTLRGIEIRNVYQGIRVEGASGVVLESLFIHNVGRECIRVRFNSTGNVVRGNRIHTCGLDGNGEAIYVGLTVSQLSKFGGKPDKSTGNLIEGNETWNLHDEGIDLKDHAGGNTVRANFVHDAAHEGGGGINVKSDGNHIVGNRIEGSAGSGIRFGGDAWNGYTTGRNNLVQNNVVVGSAEYGLKFNLSPQSASGNSGSGNRKGMYYFGENQFGV